MVAMVPLPPIFIGCWADDCDEDDYEADASLSGEEAICQPGVTTAQVEQLKAPAAHLTRHSSAAAKQQKRWRNEDGTNSTCCVLSCQASAVSSRASMAPSSPRGQTEASSTGTASVPIHQAPAAQLTTALERLQEAMRKHGFGSSPLKTEDGTNSPCCVLSCQASAASSRASTAPSSPRGPTEVSSTGPAIVPTHQAPAGQPTTAIGRLQEAMRKHGFGCSPLECAADAQAKISTFASRDYRTTEQPMDKAPIRGAARLVRQANDTQKGSFPRTRSEQGASAHDSGARSAIRRQPAEHHVPRSTIKTAPACATSVAATAEPRLAGGARMLRRSVRACAEERGCPLPRRGQPPRQQQPQEGLSAEAAHPQGPLPGAPDPAQLHEAFPTAPLGEPVQQDAEASSAVAAETAAPQEESSSPSSTEAASCLQFGTLAWDSSRDSAMVEQPDETEQHIETQPAAQEMAASMPLCFGSFTELEAADLQLFDSAAQATQQNMSPTAGNISVEAVAVSSTAVTTQPGEPVNKSTAEAMLEPTPMDQLRWPLTLPIQACSLAQTCSRWLLPQKLQLPINVAVNATISVLAATSAAVDFYKGQQQ